MQSIETTILSGLIYNDAFLRKVFPFLKDEYFTDTTDRKVFQTISEFVTKYNKPPTKQALEIAFQNDKSINETLFEKVNSLLSDIEQPDADTKWMIDETEAFCKKQSIYNAVSRSIQIIQGNDKEYREDAIPTLLQQALAVAFNSDVGHDYLKNASDRYESYHAVDERVPFKLHAMNKITGGGMQKKSLVGFLCPTGGGKTVMLCDNAAYHLSIGLNVMYFTAEMSEIRISERIDANLMNVDIGKLKELDKNQFCDRLDKIKSKTHGRLIVKEHPTSTAHVGNLRAVLEELKIKQNFVPDVIYVDYLGIYTSQRFKASGNHNSYTIIKAVAEELRGLAVEYNVPVVTAIQVNRNGLNNSDVDMTDVSESSGILYTLDFLAAMIPTPELDEQGSLMIKQLKNRWGDTNFMRRFIVGKEFNKMRFYDLDDDSSGIQKTDYEKSVEEHNKGVAGFSVKAKTRSAKFDDIKL